MSQSITLADLTIANDGPVDRVELARRSVIAAKSVHAFAGRTTSTALDSLLALAGNGTPPDPAAARILARDVTGHAETVLSEVARFAEMADKT